jgi:hypothetical protein
MVVRDANGVTIEPFMESLKTEPRRKAKYPHGVARVYLSLALAAVSMILALVLLQSSLYYLLYYALSMLAMSMLILALKIRFSGRIKPTSESDSNKTNSLEPTGGITSWKTLFAIFFILLGCLLLPISLAAILPSDVWVILIASLTTSISVAEVLFYLYSR